MDKVAQLFNAERLTVQQAAKAMGVTPRFVHMGLQRERFPFGVAIKGDGGRWSYYINANRFWAYMNAQDLRTKNADQTA